MTDQDYQAKKAKADTLEKEYRELTANYMDDPAIVADLTRSYIETLHLIWQGTPLERRTK